MSTWPASDFVGLRPWHPSRPTHDRRAQRRWSASQPL